MMPPRMPPRVPPTIAAAWLFCVLHTGTGNAEGVELGDGVSVTVGTGLGVWSVALRGVVT